MSKILGMLIVVLLVACNSSRKETATDVEINNSDIVGTWKLVYGDILENDSTTIRDLKDVDFIKIINESHFAFFNQKHNTAEYFYGGAGTYVLEGNVYKEKLNFISTEAIRGHEFVFTVEIKGDSLIQYGKEEVKEAGINRHIVEKYIRVK